jgi:hypothetical protein
VRILLWALLVTVGRVRDILNVLLACIVVYQYRKTKLMHFLFNLLRIKDLYMFRALLAHPREALHKRHLVYCVRVMSVGCTRCSPLA